LRIKNLASVALPPTRTSPVTDAAACSIAAISFCSLQRHADYRSSAHRQREPDPRCHGPAPARRNPARRPLRHQNPGRRVRRRPHRFYGTRPYADLRAEFERRLRTLQKAGDQPDPRDAQITCLKTEITGLKNRVVESTSTINELTEFRTRALARLAAQHDEIITSAGRRHLRQPSQPTSATGSDHRLMQLTERPGRQRSGVGVRTREGVGQDTTNRQPVILS
jgi:hypothetical protein